MKCLILAGGFATRLWPLTEARAKPLLLLKDKPLISHLLGALPPELPVIVSTNAVFEKDFEKWKRHFSERNVLIFAEDSENDEGKRGALGAVAHAIESLNIDEDLMVLAGDNYFGFKMSEFLAAYRGNPLLAAYDVGDFEAARKFGVVEAKDGQLTGFQEKPEHPKSTLVSTGGYIFPRERLTDIIAFSKLKKDNLGGIFEYFLEKKADVDVFPFREPWFDIGSFEAYLEANRFLTGDQVILAPGSMTGPGNRFSGSVYVATGAVISNSSLENVIVMEGSRVENCVLRNCVIDEGCTLLNLDLSHKMIRRGSRIEK